MEFQISEVILPKTVDLEPIDFHSKDELFRHMVSLFYQAGKIQSEERFLKSLYEREEMGSTLMGNDISIPHGKSETVLSPCIAFCRSKKGVPYESGGEEGIAKLTFMLAIPANTAPNDYIRVLSMLARLLMYEDFTEALYSSKDYPDVIDAIKAAETRLSE